FARRRQRQRGGQAGGAGTDYQDVVGLVSHPNSVRPELVEGPFFFPSAVLKKKRSFDKLRTNGDIGLMARLSWSAGRTRLRDQPRAWGRPRSRSRVAGPERGPGRRWKYRGCR